MQNPFQDKCLDVDCSPGKSALNSSDGWSAGFIYVRDARHVACLDECNIHHGTIMEPHVEWHGSLVAVGLLAGLLVGWLAGWLVGCGQLAGSGCQAGG